MTEQKLYPSLERKGVIELILITQVVVLFPLFQFLPTWVMMICLSVIGLRYFFKRFNRRLPSKIITAGIGVAGGVLIYLHFGTFQGRDAGVSLIVLMFSLKLLEMRWYRDAALILFLSFFILVAHFLYSQSILMAMYTVVALTVIMTTLQALNRINGADELPRLGKYAGKMLLQALPLMIILFVLFPRLSEPLWRMPSGGTGTTGISDSMTPGDIGDLVLFTEPAFRVRFDGEQPPSSQLYWRGLVFSDFDGLTWTRNESFARQRFMNDSDVEYLGPSYSYELLLEPTRRNWLYALEMPLSMSPVGRMTTDYTWIRRFPVNNKLNYQVVSFPESEFGLELDDISREINLALPDGFNPVSREWAENLRATMNSDQGFVQEVLKYINQQQYHYTLSPGTMGENGVDDFWFNKQRGFCEHYAGAFVFMMRSAGIPARVVTGYQGGEMNPFGDYMIVRQSDAHAWTEVWLEGQGWKRIDPTAAIHPSRVEVDLSQDWMQRDAIFNDEAPGDWSEFKPSWVSQISLMWDSLNSQWQESVIDYSSEKQYQMLRNMGLDHFTMSDLLNMMLIVAGVFSMISGYLMLRKRPRLDDVAKVYIRLNKKLSRNNLSRQANEGPWQHWRRIKEVNPQMADKIRPAIKLYVQLRYQAGVEQKPELLRSFKQRVASL